MCYTGFEHFIHFQNVKKYYTGFVYYIHFLNIKKKYFSLDMILVNLIKHEDSKYIVKWMYII